ncbi:MAG: transcription repressor NadR [Eubacterium sp.]|nr:transcription repressor NadR [Eubacterium sp.]
MDGESRRKKLVEILENSDTVVSGAKLSEMLHVSRQVIVQDICVLRASRTEILSTTRGYYINSMPKSGKKRIFKVYHENDELTKEMNLIVDLGAVLDDVFVYHKVYGVIQAPMNIRSRRDVQNYLQDIETGKSRPLMNLTSGYHYHTVSADSEHILDLVQEQLKENGFLAPLLDFEPVEF